MAAYTWNTLWGEEREDVYLGPGNGLGAVWGGHSKFLEEWPEGGWVDMMLSPPDLMDSVLWRGHG